ncbi:MAG: hypothetical protein LUH08_05440 [Ruminococcus sp.]|nr:hypothetical protein [Ruminococcus sp.]MCD7773482.1 hypothetical protein [Ruminococcus sp.]
MKICRTGLLSKEISIIIIVDEVNEMGTINIEKLREQEAKKNDIIKEEYKTDKEFERFHKSSQDEYEGRAKFNGKLLAIISLIVLLIFFIAYLCTTSISDVVEKNTGSSVITAEANCSQSSVFVIE